MSFRNHFLILILLNATLHQFFKGCNIFQGAWRLVHLRTLTFTPKESNETFQKFVFLPTEIIFCLRFCHFPLLFKMFYMVKLSDNAFSFKQSQKSLAYHFQRSLLLAWTAVCPLNFRLANFALFFELLFSKFWYFETHFKLYSLSLNIDMDCIPFISVYIKGILLILATNYEYAEEIKLTL